jgi:hypothetical protein
MRNWWGGVGMQAVVIATGFALCASSAFAEGLLRWVTPDGGLYVGDTPPEGSTFQGTAEKLGTVGDGWVPKARAEGTDEAPAVAAPAAPAAPVDAEPVSAEVPVAPEIEATWRKLHETLAGQPAP